MSSQPALKSHRNEDSTTTVVRVGPVQFGDGSYPVIAGPCAIESEAQMMRTAGIVARGGASMLRGGAYKPRTSPYSFQGLGPEGLRILEKAGRRTGLPTVSEVMEPADVDLVASHVDMLQVGSRNMQNFALLRAVARSGKPILLKRGLAATVDEWLLAAEYILDGGNAQVVLCERGIRTFETSTRNTLDIGAVPVVKAISHLPVTIDPSHASGRRDLIMPFALAGRAVGADGMMVEVHPEPDRALSDGPQQLDAAGFEQLMEALGIVSVREDIDRIDRQILRLLAQRLSRSLEIGQAKMARGLPLHSPGREAEILAGLAAEAEGSGLDPQVVRALFETILHQSRRAQRHSLTPLAAAAGRSRTGA
ncbi:MAG: 3-deoxy-7-phosphoheptulonate synthase [Actinobacteria bacterium]|nr:3-deoxy-7-phosphoheptulonate synthase [Actinomycetota bacterium]